MINKFLLNVKINIKRFINKTLRRNETQLIYLKDLTSLSLIESIQSNHKNPLLKYGKKCFSQNDEDGITLEILRRIDILQNGSFAEYGVDDGTENNTLILKSLGWKGFWIGGGSLAFNNNPNDDSFAYIKNWITIDNILPLTNDGLKKINIEKLDVISLDLDGNDYFFIEKLLSSSILPKVFIVEYNAKFPPPIKWSVSYDESHTWDRDDYFGASLSSFSDLFERFNYKLICCNITGANAFFVKNEFSNLFQDIPTDINDIYSPPRYGINYPFRYKLSKKTILNLFK
jgi:hypothetical protein